MDQRNQNGGILSELKVSFKAGFHMRSVLKNNPDKIEGILPKVIEEFARKGEWAFRVLQLCSQSLQKPTDCIQLQITNTDCLMYKAICFVMPLFYYGGQITPRCHRYLEAARIEDAVSSSPLPLVQSLSLSRLALAVPRESLM